LGNAVLEDTIVEEDIHPVYVSEGLTDTGKVRTANQDAFVQLGARGVWGVADGMGGYRDGDVASRMVCEGCSAWTALRRSKAPSMPFASA